MSYTAILGSAGATPGSIQPGVADSGHTGGIVWATAPNVFDIPRLIVEIALDPGPGLDAQQASTSLRLDNVTTPIGTGRLGAVPVWFEITKDVLHVDYTYGRTSGSLSDLAQPAVGTATITLDNFSGDYDPANPNGAYADGAGGTRLLPMRQVQIRAEWHGTTYYLWRGYIEDLTPDFGMSPSATMTCIDVLGVFALTTLPKLGSPAFAYDTTGVRVARILATISWPLSLMGVDAGSTQMSATDYGDTALALCQAAATADGGMMFADTRTGAVIFWGRHLMYSNPRSVTAQATFSDAVMAPAAIEYDTLRVSYGASTIANSVTVTRTGGTPQTATDATSQGLYFQRALPGAPSNLQMAYDADALSLAQWLLAQYKDPDLRISDITADVMTQNMWEEVLGLQLWDRIRVVRSYTSDYTYDKQLVVQGITHTIVPFQSWQIKLTTTTPSRIAPFLLDVSALDQAQYGY